MRLEQLAWIVLFSTTMCSADSNGHKHQPTATSVDHMMVHSFINTEQSNPQMSLAITDSPDKEEPEQLKENVHHVSDPPDQSEDYRNGDSAFGKLTDTDAGPNNRSDTDLEKIKDKEQDRQRRININPTSDNPMSTNSRIRPLMYIDIVPIPNPDNTLETNNNIRPTDNSEDHRNPDLNSQMEIAVERTVGKPTRQPEEDQTSALEDFAEPPSNATVPVMPQNRQSNPLQPDIDLTIHVASEGKFYRYVNMIYSTADPTVVVWFVLHFCTKEAQKGNDVSSAWKILMDCRKDVVWDKSSNNWHNMFSDSNYIGDIVHSIGCDHRSGSENEDTSVAKPHDSSVGHAIGPYYDSGEEDCAEEDQNTNTVINHKPEIRIKMNVQPQPQPENTIINGTQIDDRVNASEYKSKSAAETFNRRENIFCEIKTGSFHQIPRLEVCYQRNRSQTTCMHDIQSLNSKSLLSKCKLGFHGVLQMKMAWVLRKVNLSIDGLMVLCLVLPWVRNKFNKHLQEWENKSLVVVFLTWLLWRLQETVNLDMTWQIYVPYICNVTNSVRYVLEAIMLYTSSYTAINRYL